VGCAKTRRRVVADAAQAPVGGSWSPGFELEGILAKDGRVRISGWWHGVRGRRFIRPSLSAVGGRSGIRALAELEHKPWAPEGSEPWLAEFVWEHPLHDVEAFELAVAPDLAVRIPLPGASKRARKRAARPAPAANETVQRPLDGSVQAADRQRVVTPLRGPAPQIAAALPVDVRLARIEQERDRARAASDQAIAERDVLAGNLDQAVAEGERLLEERDAAIERAASGMAELDRAVAECRRLRDERDRAVRARDEALASRQRMEGERDALAAERRALVADRAQLLQGRDQARAERNGLLEQHAKHQTERERLAHEHDRALALRDAVAAERDRYRDARNEAMADCRAAAGELERVREERDRYRDARDEAVAERDGAAAELQRVREEPDRYRDARNEAMAERDAAAAELEHVREERDRYRDARDEAVAERETAIGELERVRRERDAAVANARRASHERDQARTAHEVAAAALRDDEPARAALTAELNVARSMASQLMRERDHAWATLAGLRRSQAAPAAEQSRTGTVIAKPRAELMRPRTDCYRSSDATPPVQRQRAPHRITADYANSTASLLGRAVAVIGVLAIALIVVLIVLSR
jgi:hypothetical protein